MRDTEKRLIQEEAIRKTVRWLNVVLDVARPNPEQGDRFDEDHVTHCLMAGVGEVLDQEFEEWRAEERLKALHACSDAACRVLQAVPEDVRDLCIDAMADEVDRIDDDTHQPAAPYREERRGE